MTDIREILDEFGSTLVRDIQDRIASYGLGGSNLMQSVDYKVDGNEVKVTAAGYFDFAEKGRGPGGVPRNFEDILKSWASRRGIHFDNEDRAVRAIKWSTIRYGSDLYRHPEKQRDFIGDTIDENIERLKEHVATFILEQ